MEKIKPKILVIIGPTAVGKSDLAIKLAKRFNGEVISADSRQVYKGMDIGSGKITKSEMKGVPHHLLDVANPKSTYTVAQYKKDSLDAIHDILRRGKLPIICGGTGFYIQALVDGMILPNVPPNPKLRKILEKKTVTELYKILKKLDPSRAKTIDRSNPRRLIRAIEIAEVLGKVPEISKESPSFNPLFIGLTLPKEILKKNIEKRYDKRIKKGMIQEVKKLRLQGVSWKRLESFGLEYRTIALFLQNRVTEDEMRERVITESMQYTKRQMQWWKRDQRVVWSAPTQISSIKSLAATFLKDKNRV